MNFPIYLKTEESEELCAEEFAYVLTGNGLFLNRRTPFFESSVPTKRWPPELAFHKPSLKHRFPLIPKALIERVIGFLDTMFTLSGNEAIALFQWRDEGGYEVVIPPQECTDVRGWDFRRAPFYTRYEVPIAAPGTRWLGDIHSHGPWPAFFSALDDHDDKHVPGFHVVLGCLDRRQEEVDLVAAVTVDNFAFDIAPMSLFEGYERRRYDFPKEWLQNVTIVSAQEYSIPRVRPHKPPRRTP